MTTPVYDRIGNDYDTTRRADPYLATRMAHLLEVQAGGHYVDLACGTGNYTIALACRGGSWTGIDASAAMIEQARRKTSRIHWQCGTAESLAIHGPYDSVLCSLA